MALAAPLLIARLTAPKDPLLVLQRFGRRDRRASQLGQTLAEGCHCRGFSSTSGGGLHMPNSCYERPGRSDSRQRRRHDYPEAISSNVWTADTFWPKRGAEPSLQALQRSRVRACTHVSLPAQGGAIERGTAEVDRKRFATTIPRPKIVRDSSCLARVNSVFSRSLDVGRVLCRNEFESTPRACGRPSVRFPTLATVDLPAEICSLAQPRSCDAKCNWAIQQTGRSARRLGTIRRQKSQ